MMEQKKVLERGRGKQYIYAKGTSGSGFRDQ